MKIGLIDIEPKIVNTALMQVSAYHKSKGDTVEWAMPLAYDRYDKLYCSSLFDYTSKRNIPDRTECGGTGYDLTKQLPIQFDVDYDYSMYPNCDYSIVWFSRGCIRNCPFCVVRQKEGYMKSVDMKNLNPKGKYISIQDNNFFANPLWPKAIRVLQRIEHPVSFNGGIDLRLLDDEQCNALLTLKQHKRIKIAWDNPKEDLRDKLKWLISKIKAYRIMCYVLIGYWSTPEQDHDRVMYLASLGIDPFVMAYNKKDEYQRRFARWVNRQAVFKSCTWKDYKG